MAQRIAKGAVWGLGAIVGAWGVGVAGYYAVRGAVWVVAVWAVLLGAL